MLKFTNPWCQPSALSSDPHASDLLKSCTDNLNSLTARHLSMPVFPEEAEEGRAELQHPLLLPQLCSGEHTDLLHQGGVAAAQGQRSRHCRGLHRGSLDAAYQPFWTFTPADAEIEHPA